MNFKLERLRGSAIFESAHLSHDLVGKSLRGGGVTMASQGIMVGVNLIRTIILARLLTPYDFGLIGMVTVVVAFATMFKDSGLSMATVQRSHITEEQISSLFWCNVALSLALGMVICLASPGVALFYGKPELTLITIALSIPFVLSGLQIQHLALLKRHMLFGQIAMVNIVSSIIALIVAVILSMKGFRYWALIGSSCAQAICGLCLSIFFCSWRPKRFYRGVGVKSMLMFGGHLTGFNLLNFFSRNLDYILIGRFLGVDALGVYQRAYTLMMQPLQNLNGPLSTVGTPAMSRLQNEPERYRKYFIQAGALLLMVTMPVAAFSIIMSREIILVLFGGQWEQAIKPFMYLSICLIGQPLGNITGWLFISQGRAKDMMIWGFIGSSITMISISLGLFWGITGVAASYALFGLFVTMPILFWFVGCKGAVSTADLISIFSKKVGLFFCFFVGIYITRKLLLSLDITALWVFLIQLFIFSGSMVAVMALADDSRVLRVKLLDFIHRRSGVKSH